VKNGVRFNKNEILGKNLAQVIVSQLTSPEDEENEHLVIMSPSVEDSYDIRGIVLNYLKVSGIEFENVEEMFNSKVWRIRDFEIHFDVLEHKIHFLSDLSDRDVYVEDDESFMVWISNDALEII